MIRDRGLGRRDFLKTAGAAFVGAGLAGTAAADRHDVDDYDTDTDVSVAIAYFGDEPGMPRYSLEISGATDIDGMYGIDVEEDEHHRHTERVATYEYDDPQEEGYRWEWADVFDELVDTADYPVAALPVNGDTVYSVFDMATIAAEITYEEPDRYGDIGDEHIYALPVHALVADVDTPEDAVLEFLYEDEQLDLDNLHMEMLYFGDDMEDSHGIIFNYPEPFYEEAEPGIESVGLYSLDMDDHTQEPFQNTSHVEELTLPRNRVGKMLTSGPYQDIIDAGRFTVLQVTPETGDNAYGVFDMDAIDIAAPDNGVEPYILADHEKTITPTPEGAVTHYLEEIGER